VFVIRQRFSNNKNFLKNIKDVRTKVIKKFREANKRETDDSNDECMCDRDAAH
jgi:hypothetical protein